MRGKNFVKDADLTLVVGKRGSGKSTITKGLLLNRPKVIIFDPRAEYTRGVQCRTIEQVRRAMLTRWARGFVISFVPPAGGEAASLSALIHFLWKAQRPYEEETDARKMTLVIEEMDLGYPVSKLPANMRGMDRAVNQGRHVGLELIGVTQRPALVSMNFRSQVASTYLFALEGENDVKTMANAFGKHLENNIRNMPKYHCLMRNDGRVIGLKTSRSGRITPFSI
tara:strand:- start:6048 stop:6722 length:675 start_codon:yes stop_codon:yes gene_type:complete